MLPASLAFIGGLAVLVSLVLIIELNQYVLGILVMTGPFIYLAVVIGAAEVRERRTRRLTNDN